ncbi:hypothetical protein Tco_0924556 [Tanacetum coccineum]|uniref:Uncharacterized protein n=1 Tax=Tanacetum coccineum TaxID=301880 RepID=A0ABQ5D579_9ASTR
MEGKGRANAIVKNGEGKGKNLKGKSWRENRECLICRFGLWFDTTSAVIMVVMGGQWGVAVGSGCFSGVSWGVVFGFDRGLCVSVGEGVARMMLGQARVDYAWGTGYQCTRPGGQCLECGGIRCTYTKFNRPVDDLPESELPPRKRLCLSTLSSRYEVGESSTARPTGGQGIDYGFISTVDAEARRQGISEVGYGIRDTWVDRQNGGVRVPEIAPTKTGGRGQYSRFTRPLAELMKRAYNRTCDPSGVLGPIVIMCYTHSRPISWHIRHNLYSCQRYSHSEHNHQVNISNPFPKMQQRLSIGQRFKGLTVEIRLNYRETLPGDERHGDER